MGIAMARGGGGGGARGSRTCGESRGGNREGADIVSHQLTQTREHSRARRLTGLIPKITSLVKTGQPGSHVISREA